MQTATVETGRAVAAATVETGRFFQTLPGALDQSFNEGVQTLGEAAEDAVHNFHGAPVCTRESQNLGTAMGARFRTKVVQQAESFFATVRPQIERLPPEQRAAAVAEAFQRFYDSVVARRNQASARGRDKVDDWSVNPHFQRQYADALQRTFESAAGDVRRDLDSVYRRPEKVGRSWM